MTAADCLICERRIKSTGVRWGEGFAHKDCAQFERNRRRLLAGEGADTRPVHTRRQGHRARRRR
jgi:hypothetical protein